MGTSKMGGSGWEWMGVDGSGWMWMGVGRSTVYYNPSIQVLLQVDNKSHKYCFLKAL